MAAHKHGRQALEHERQKARRKRHPHTKQIALTNYRTNQGAVTRIK
ncbi:MAG: hypothetical protein ABF532_09525 [Bifidobacterium sp.]|jgi:hypothetical protein